MNLEQNTQRASSLTRQLLAFGRRQVNQPEVLDITTVVQELLPMLKQLLTESVQVKLELRTDDCYVFADRGQIEQVIVNLVVNARDAMPEGGILEIRSAKRLVKNDFVVKPSRIKEGEFVVLTIADSGMGIPADVIDHVFEPFFTTKALGNGTGLGLATVHGVVEQSNGFVSVTSEEGKGSSFEVFLPVALIDAARQQPLSLGKEDESCLRGSGLILLCEDEDTVRGLAKEFLELAGYTVVGTKDGAAALGWAKDNIETIDLLVTDVVMPQMNGKQLASRIHELKQDIPVLFISGYAANIIVNHGILDEGVNLLEKPFDREALLEKVAATIRRKVQQS